jgi:hypothetical protein
MSLVLEADLGEPEELYIKFKDHRKYRDTDWVQYGIIYEGIMSNDTKEQLRKLLIDTKSRQSTYDQIKTWLGSCLGEIVGIQYVNGLAQDYVMNGDNRIAILTLDNMNLEIRIGTTVVRDPLIAGCSLLVIDPKSKVDELLGQKPRFDSGSTEPLDADYHLPLWAKHVVYIEFI